jgi:hypothetical protein
VLRDFKGMPDKKKLETFRNPGQLNRFSEELVREVLNKGTTR